MLYLGDSNSGFFTSKAPPTTHTRREHRNMSKENCTIVAYNPRQEGSTNEANLASANPALKKSHLHKEKVT